ncbi:efflux RND transporter periplasmic adaptor subunit [Carboxylicivirga sp. N1Y90]|uniref:efflux RND transporter periplasmic adaptor subunit n=1 Tax=Carboxylicivirga fragile TaxID=3417571 RepID=UPI003D32ED92|nr:efflux RND transporter periplasmic adaptor subunit [Marinilabiliaceae bacterium N1Y90]
MTIQKIRKGSYLFVGAILFFNACTTKQSSLKKGEFQTSTVERGRVENWELTEGIVEPSNEVLLLSPAASIIEEIIKKPGQKVAKGDVIVRLNKDLIVAKIDNINDQLEVKQNSLDKTRLNARSTRADLTYNTEVKKLKIASIESTIADQEQLLEVGGISQAKFEKTLQELVLAEKDLQLAKQKNAIKLEQLKTDEKGLLLQIDMQQKELEKQKVLLEKMDVKAPSDGIILNVHAQRGAKIQVDKLLVNMADLTQFEIKASIDNKHKRIVKTGKRAYVLVDKARLEGRIGIVEPTLVDGKVQFSVNLDESNHPSLVPNQKVKIQVVRRAKNDVLRVKNGPAFGKQTNQYGFVISRDSAIRHKILLGLITEDYVEIKEGVEEGSLLVISKVDGIKHLPAVKIELP